MKAKHLQPFCKSVENKTGQLFIEGQGTVEVTLNKKAPFKIYVTLPKSKTGFSLSVDETNATFVYSNGEIQTVLCSSKPDTNAGIDQELSCNYWFSLDKENRCLRYGKGEQRLQTAIMSCSATEDSIWTSTAQIENVLVAGEAEKVQIWRDPVTIDPPLLVVPHNQITMEMAASYKATVVENLSVECQKLYGNIAGDLFQLNTLDFPHFSDAIANSISNPNGWCCQTLEKKANEFGSYEPLATYLRITLGVNQGESPGIPYVLEIWPNQHYSPIHNHAGANAAIKVLFGEITVSLFDMLSTCHTSPYSQVVLKKGDVTWISPGLNQTHQLCNKSADGGFCATIQCYLYDIDSHSHYEYFDYIDNEGKNIKQFSPNSDMDFLEFKEQMKKEWETLKGKQ